MRDKENTSPDKEEYIQLNKFYSSNDYIIITAQEGDHQIFVVKKRK